LDDNLCLLSIVVPVYNVEETLEACVASILKSISSCDKKYPIELLLVEDCSTDRSAEVAAKIAEDVSICRLVRHPENLGLAQVRNTGIKESRGDYVAWVDSDDLVEPKWFGAIMSALALASVDVVAFDFIRQHADGRRVPNEYGKKCLLLECGAILASPALWVKDVLRSLETFAFTVTKVFRRSILLSYGFDAPRGALEDMGFMLDAAPAVKSVYYIPVPLYVYRISAVGLVGTLDVRRRLFHVAYALGKIRKLPLELKIPAMVSVAQLLIEVRHVVATACDVQSRSECMKYMRSALPYLMFDSKLGAKHKIVYFLCGFPIFDVVLKWLWRVRSNDSRGRVTN